MTSQRVSEIFDPELWEEGDGFALTDITYHRAKDVGAVRIAFDRPEVRNAFRPHTVDELYRVLDHARMTPDVGCVLLTGNGPSPRDGGWAFCSGGDQRIRGRSGYQYATGETADTVDEARVKAAGGRLHVLEVQRLIRQFAFNPTDDGMVGQQVFAGEATRLAYMTDEAVEGRDAFLEKRAPDWSPFPWYF